jgi:DNA repair protein RadA/Sms
LLLQIAASVASLSTPTPGIGRGPAVMADLLPDGTPNGDADAGPVWYVSGEENPQQIASRASRLGIHEPELFLLSETHADTLAEQIVAHLDYDAPADSEEGMYRKKPPSLVVIDSIQTMICDSGGSSAAGGITQVKECVALFLRLAKSTGIPVFLVGHVTKAGGVAGPRTVEHMVDCVLYLEGTDLGGSINLRVLRASKNRFGSADEVGVYEMTSGRLLPVSDPSSLFLAHRDTEDDSEGCAIAIALEGMRAITVEVQALVTPAGGNAGFGRRTVDGIANSRLMLLMGVLQKRCGMFMGKQDVYINVVGRMRLDRGEGNSADLAVAMALASSLTSIAVRSDTAFVGEIGLLGELRHVPALEKRIQEARRMGFSRVVTPRDAASRRLSRKKSGQRTTSSQMTGLEWIQCDTLLDAITAGLVQPLPKRKPKRTSPRAANGSSPGRLEDLGLDEIMDDEEDEDVFL